MSTDIHWIEWIEKCIKEGRIKHYEYNEFNKIEKISDEVYRANWKQNEKCFALKSFCLDNAIVKHIVDEVCKRDNENFNEVDLLLRKFYYILDKITSGS
jgi:hypothetical protein